MTMPTLPSRLTMPTLPTTPTLNATTLGRPADPRRIDGPDRTLDALIGLIVFAASVTILLLGISELYRVGTAIVDRSGSSESLEVGFIIALGGTILFGGITTLSFLVKLARGHRSWRTPLWGAILSSAAQIIGFLIMTTAL
jgi:hypothetical protein